MFQNYARVTNNNGLYFYSKDIFINDYMFKNDIEIKIASNYYNNGIGVVLINETTPEEDMFLIKISNYSLNIIHKHYRGQDHLYQITHPYKTPIKDFVFYLNKSGNLITVRDKNKNLICEYNLPTVIEKYKFGLYSNKGNTINNITIVSGVPNRWITNTNNTNGGRIDFIKNGFVIEGCRNNAEIEQSNIKLPSGRYYLKFNTEDIRGKFDVKTYVYESDRPEIDPKEKDILIHENDLYYVDIIDDTKVNIRFEGTNGKITNMALVNNIGDAFVPTEDKVNKRIGGQIKITPDNSVAKIEIGATVNTELQNKEDINLLFKGAKSNVNRYSINLLTNNIHYKYSLDFNDKSIRITNENNDNIPIDIQVYEKIKQIINEHEFYIFYNMNAIISSIKIIYQDGREEDLMVQQTKKYYIPGDIQSPILVSTNNTPLTLSSSYRVIETDNEDKVYKFTNWERERFVGTNTFELSNLPDLNEGAIYIYAIPNEAITDKDKFHSVNEIANDITLYTDIFDTIPFSGEYYYAYANTLQLPKNDDYKEYVIEYLKKDSYCINYDFKDKQYEVDVSSSEDDVDIHYDYTNLIVHGDGETSKYVTLSL